MLKIQKWTRSRWVFASVCLCCVLLSTEGKGQASNSDNQAALEALKRVDIALQRVEKHTSAVNSYIRSSHPWLSNLTFENIQREMDALHAQTLLMRHEMVQIMKEFSKTSPDAVAGSKELSGLRLTLTGLQKELKKAQHAPDVGRILRDEIETLRGDLSPRLAAIEKQSLEANEENRRLQTDLAHEISSLAQELKSHLEHVRQLSEKTSSVADRLDGMTPAVPGDALRKKMEATQWDKKLDALLGTVVVLLILLGIVAALSGYAAFWRLPRLEKGMEAESRLQQAESRELLGDVRRAVEGVAHRQTAQSEYMDEAARRGEEIYSLLLGLAAHEETAADDDDAVRPAPVPFIEEIRALEHDIERVEASLTSLRSSLNTAHYSTVSEELMNRVNALLEVRLSQLILNDRGSQLRKPDWTTASAIPKLQGSVTFQE